MKRKIALLAAVFVLAFSLSAHAGYQLPSMVGNWMKMPQPSVSMPYPTGSMTVWSYFNMASGESMAVNIYKDNEPPKTYINIGPQMHVSFDPSAFAPVDENAIAGMVNDALK